MKLRKRVCLLCIAAMMLLSLNACTRGDAGETGTETAIVTSGNTDNNEAESSKDAEPSNNAEPSKDSEPSKTTDASDSVTPSANGEASLSKPVEMNQKYTWSETKEWLHDTISGTYSCTVKGIEKISADDIVKLGFKKPKDNELLEYALVDVVWEVNNAKLTKGTGNGEANLSTAWEMAVWGVKTESGNSIICGTTYGFDGCIKDAIYKATASKKVTPGMNESFKAEGKVLISLFKNTTNFLVLRNNEIDDYKNCFMHFKLN